MKKKHWKYKICKHKYLRNISELKIKIEKKIKTILS